MSNVETNRISSNTKLNGNSFRQAVIHFRPAKLYKLPLDKPAIVRGTHGEQCRKTLNLALERGHAEELFKTISQSITVFKVERRAFNPLGKRNTDSVCGVGRGSAYTLDVFGAEFAKDCGLFTNGCIVLKEVS